MPELYPCPCCGGEAYFEKSLYGCRYVRVLCSKCGLSITWRKNAEHAAKAWNNRVWNRGRVLSKGEVKT